MAYRELGMVELREIVRRWQGGEGVRAIARGTGMDRKTIGEYLRALQAVGVQPGGPPPNEPDHHLARRSSSAFAKNADASFRISFASFSSRFSRSSSFSRGRSSVVNPGRRRASRSAWRTQCRNVSAVQPIFPAMDSMAAHCDACSPWCSNTSRTARFPDFR
jgi:hypothetical protein